MENLVLIDGNSLINRAFYAMPPLTNAEGVYTNAVYGFMNMLFRALGEIKPQYLAVAFDLKAPTFRHALYADYKGTRKPMPEELRPQIPLLKDLLRDMGIAVFEKEGVEADDIIGTIAKHTDVNTIIFTGDKDSFQLVDEQTEVHFTKRGITDVEIYTAQNFKEKTGLNPTQIIDLKSLMGDSSDNIPGVKGVGEKTAHSLITTYSTTFGVYEHIGELKGKLKERLIENEQTALLSRTLATINTDCGVDTDVRKMRLTLPFPQIARQRFTELGFKTLLAKLDQLSGDTPDTEQAPTQAPAPASPTAIVPQLIQPTTLDGVAQGLAGKTVTLALCEKTVNLYDGQTEYSLSFITNLIDAGFSLGEIISGLKPLFADAKRIITFNKKETRHLLANYGLDITCPCEDVSILKYLADYTGKEEKLDGVIAGYGLPGEYPAASLYSAYLFLTEKLKYEQMERLYGELELPLSDVLYDMEVAGFKVDYAALTRAGEKYRAKLTDIEARVRDYAQDQTLNLNSPKQLGDLLFERLRLGKGKKNRHGYSTSAEILEALEDAHPVVPLILEYRKVQKIYSTYIEGFKPLIDRSTGLIKTVFNQTVTSTGRLSSKEPNLQNIPVREEEGRELRKFFVPRDSEHILIGADYSQIELRLLADFANCQSLIDAFNQNADIHSATAAKVFGLAPQNVTPEKRRAAKAVNFGIIYGISEYGLAKNIKTDAVEARAYINAYFKEYPEVREYMEENVYRAKQTGYAVTLLGRRRYINEINSANRNVASFGERAAMNMPLQGSSADIIKLAMLGVHARLKKENLQSKLILQVHDELIIDALKTEQEAVKRILVEEMEGAVKLKVRLTVDLGIGESWYDAK